MNFCLKNHLFTRKIQSIRQKRSGNVIVYFKQQHPYGTEYIDFNKEEFFKLSLNLPIDNDFLNTSQKTPD